MRYKIVDIPPEEFPGKRTNPLHDRLFARVMRAPVGVTVKVKVPLLNRRIDIWKYFKRYRAKELTCTVNRRGNYVLITKTQI